MKTPLRTIEDACPQGPGGTWGRCFDRGPSASPFPPAGVLGDLAQLLEIGDVLLERRGEREKGTGRTDEGKRVW